VLASEKSQFIVTFFGDLSMDPTTLEVVSFTFARKEGLVPLKCILLTAGHKESFAGKTDSLRDDRGMFGDGWGW